MNFNTSELVVYKIEIAHRTPERASGDDAMYGASAGQKNAALTRTKALAKCSLGGLHDRAVIRKGHA